MSATEGLASERAMLAETVARVVADHETAATAPDGVVDEALWAVLEELGLTTLGVAPELGGSGGTKGDGLVVVEELARAGSSAPVAEHLLAAWVAQEAGLALPEGRATVALPPAGTLAADVVDAMGWAVPWGRSASHVVRLAPGSTGLEVELWPVVGAAVTAGANVAGEPRDTMRYPHASRMAMGPVADGSLPVRLHRWVALVRNAQTIGALASAQALTIEHVTSRQQFGRPIGAFQAVRNLAAVMAGEVAVASAAQRAATRPLDAGLEPDALAVAAAKLRGAMAATRVAAIAHELHGAIGTTREHRLHLFTRRLWAARDEGGTEAEWEDELGTLARQAGTDGLWALLTDPGPHA